jgi:hypothetical protein
MKNKLKNSFLTLARSLPVDLGGKGGLCHKTSDDFVVNGYKQSVKSLVVFVRKFGLCMILG